MTRHRLAYFAQPLWEQNATALGRHPRPRQSKLKSSQRAMTTRRSLPPQDVRLRTETAGTDSTLTSTYPGSKTSSFGIHSSFTTKSRKFQSMLSAACRIYRQNPRYRVRHAGRLDPQHDSPSARTYVRCRDRRLHWAAASDLKSRQSQLGEISTTLRRRRQIHLPPRPRRQLSIVRV